MLPDDQAAGTAIILMARSLNLLNYCRGRGERGARAGWNRRESTSRFLFARPVPAMSF